MLGNPSSHGKEANRGCLCVFCFSHGLSRVSRAPLLAQWVGESPASVRAHWLAHASIEVPDWLPNSADWPLVAGALMQLFDACRHAPDCALPSPAADSLWHVWLARAPVRLASFQRHHFEREMPHVACEGIDLEAGPRTLLGAGLPQRALVASG